MADSRIPAAITKLVAVFEAALAGDADAHVFDGPVLSEVEPQKQVYVGWDGDPEGEFVAVSSDQGWASTIGTAQRNESFSVLCSALVTDGGGTPTDVRTSAFALFATLSTAVRANVTLDLPSPTKAEARNPTLFYRHDANTGLEARIAFEVQVNTRI